MLEAGHEEKKTKGFGGVRLMRVEVGRGPGKQSKGRGADCEETGESAALDSDWIQLQAAGRWGDFRMYLSTLPATTSGRPLEALLSNGFWGSTVQKMYTVPYHDFQRFRGCRASDSPTYAMGTE